MTMPHLMNCSHSETGWCLNCVGELYGEKTAERICECDFFETGMHTLQGLFYISYAHGSKTVLKKFEFCPWCGGKLPHKTKESKNAK